MPSCVHRPRETRSLTAYETPFAAGDGGAYLREQVVYSSNRFLLLPRRCRLRCFGLGIDRRPMVVSGTFGRDRRRLGRESHHSFVPVAESDLVPDELGV